MAKRKAAPPDIESPDAEAEWVSALVPPLDYVVALMEAAQTYAKFIGEEPPKANRQAWDDASMCAGLRYKSLCDGMKIGGWSGWTPPMIGKLSSVCQRIEWMEGAIRGDDDRHNPYIGPLVDGLADGPTADELEHLADHIRRDADDVAHTARRVVELRAETTVAVKRERNRGEGISGPKKDREQHARERFATLRADDPHGDKGPLVDRICREQGISRRTAETYLTGLV